jgi:quercetin dioxygenase-like cupin family protein
MKVASFADGIEFNDTHTTASVIMETSFSKEIRILFRKDQIMKEHKTAYPIAVHVLEGHIDFRVNGEVHQLKKGSIITLQGNVPHDLTALEESIVRLTLSKLDNIERVEKVATES